MSKSKYVVRIESITLENFKNIGYGSIYFGEYKSFLRKVLPDDDFSNVVGIYGQNASGKTSVIDALQTVRRFVSGGALNFYIKNYIRKGSDHFTIMIDFLLSNKKDSHFVTYSFTLAEKNNNVYIESESLACESGNIKTNTLGTRKQLYGYSSEKGIKENLLSSFKTKEKRAILNYVASQKSHTSIGTTKYLSSSLFNPESISIVKDECQDALIVDIINSLTDFAKNKFLIVTPNIYEGIGGKGVGVNGFDVDENDSKIHKNYAIPFTKQIFFESKYKEFLRMLNSCSKVLNTLIPGLIIKTHVFAERDGYNGEKEIEFEVVSVRDGKEIPLFYESRGVKQMLTYVGDLIEVFNEEGTFIAIDELDSGVFEYLLGEMVYSFDNFAMGQLLFTSHNFRILEKIKPSEIFFTTANEQNKFVQPKYIKSNNNLRNVYYRLIVQGDDKEVYYNKTSSSDISKVFSSLGRVHKWKGAF